MNMVLDPLDEGTHECEPLAEENRKREEDGEVSVFIFADMDDEWTLRVGSEFVNIRCCPFCGE